MYDLLKENPPLSVRPLGDIYSESIKISVYANDDELYAFIVCNHPNESGFKILPLPIDQQQEGHTTYAIDISFKEIWPIKDEVDPNFGRITVTEPVNTNHLAIGYGNITTQDDLLLLTLYASRHWKNLRCTIIASPSTSKRCF